MCAGFSMRRGMCYVHESTEVTYSEVLYYKVQYVDQLRNCVALFHDNLPGPVREHLMAVLHPSRHRGREDCHGLTDDGTGFHGVSLQKTVENLHRDVNVQ